MFRVCSICFSTSALLKLYNHGELTSMFVFVTSNSVHAFYSDLIYMTSRWLYDLGWGYSDFPDNPPETPIEGLQSLLPDPSKSRNVRI